MESATMEQLAARPMTEVERKRQERAARFGIVKDDEETPSSEQTADSVRRGGSKKCLDCVILLIIL